MKAKNRIGFGAGVIGLLTTCIVQAATQIQSMDFKDTGDSNTIELTADGPIQFTKQENATDKQVVVELSGANFGPNASRPLDTSSFTDSAIRLVSPFQVEGQPDNARLVVQLKDMAAADVTQEGNTLKIKIAKPAGATPSAATAEATPPPPTEATPPPPLDAGAQAKALAAPEATPATPDDRLNGFLKAQETQRFMGKPISMQLRDADLVDVFRLIGEASGFNIVVGDDVKGRVTLSLTEVPWDQALDMVLRTNKLGAERNNNILRIAALSSLVQEKNQQLQAKLASEATAPRVTRIFPISYANLGDIQRILQAFVSGSSNAAPGVGSGAVGGATVQTDARTNSVIVRDTIENIDKMKSLIEMLDTQTPQVLIEAKVVEVSKGFTRNIKGNIGLGGGGLSALPFFGGSFNGGSISSLTGFPTSIDTSNLFGASINFGIIPGSTTTLNAILGVGESENTVKVVSSPRVIVLNKQSANILQSETFLGPPVATGANGTVAETVPMISATTSLNAIPTVTNDGSVLMDLTLSRDVPKLIDANTSVIQPRNIKTQVLVESGSTLAIGGVHSKSDTDSGSGFPFLRKIPVLGWFFGDQGKVSNEVELFFFITPKILNLRESGLAGPTT